MLTRLPGSLVTFGSTEKLRPTGWPGVGYGSWPTISTVTSSNGCLKARSTFSPDGKYLRPAAICSRRKSPIAAIWCLTGSSAAAQPASTMLLNGSGMGRTLVRPPASAERYAWLNGLAGSAELVKKGNLRMLDAGMRGGRHCPSPWVLCLEPDTWNDGAHERTCASRRRRRGAGGDAWHRAPRGGVRADVRGRRGQGTRGL